MTVRLQNISPEKLRCPAGCGGSVWAKVVTQSTDTKPVAAEELAGHRVVTMSCSICSSRWLPA